MIETPGTSLNKGIVASPQSQTHTAAHTVDTLRALKFEVLKHPPYRLDLAPLDFNFFRPMKEHLRGQKFAYDELMRRCKAGQRPRKKNFSIEGIRKLADRWTKCIAKQGACVQK